MIDNSFIYRKAELLYENENYEQALHLFENLENSEENADIQNYIGCCYLKLGQYVKAKKIFEIISIMNPDWNRPIYNLGRAYFKLNEFDKALLCFNKAVHINPDDADAYYYRAVYYEKIEDYDNAISDYNHSVFLKPNEFESHMGLCVCYDNIGNEQKALNEAKKAFELFYCNDTLYNYTYFLNKLKRFDDSFNLLEKYNAILSDDIGLLKNLMFCSKKLGKDQQCFECAKKILEEYPNDSFAKKIIIDINQNGSEIDS